jgi:ankyrin repeat protein
LEIKIDYEDMSERPEIHRVHQEPLRLESSGASDSPISPIFASILEFATGTKQSSVIHDAAEGGDAKRVLRCLAAGQDVDSTNDVGTTALHNVTLFKKKNFSMKCCRSFVSAVAFSTKTKACRFGHIDVVEVLLDHKANINAMSNDGMTPLMEAQKGGHFVIVRRLESGLTPTYSIFKCAPTGKTSGLKEKHNAPTIWNIPTAVWNLGPDTAISFTVAGCKYQGVVKEYRGKEEVYHIELPAGVEAFIQVAFFVYVCPTVQYVVQ